MKIPVVLISFLVSGLSFGQQGCRLQAPNDLGDGWKVSSLTSLKMDTSRICRLMGHLENNPHKIHSLLLVKNDYLLVEEYFSGYSPEKLHDLRSVTKSIRSLLMGIAIDLGYVESIDDPISKYLGKYWSEQLQEEKGGITIRHLLTMSTGLDCNDWDKKSKGQEDKVHKKKDWIQYTLDLPVRNDPGTISHYCSMGTVLAAEIISQAAGMSMDEFARQYLFDPLGITNVRWGHTSGNGVLNSGKRLYLAPRDMAKIGQLVLNQGLWNGMQIVSADWLLAATSPQTKITGIDYGFLWWSIPFQANEKVMLAQTATGNGGQYIFVFPELNAVAVFTGGAYNSEEDKAPFAVVRDIFLPLLMK